MFTGPWSILQYFQPKISYHLSIRPLFCLFLSGRLRQVLLYLIIMFTGPTTTVQTTATPGVDLSAQEPAPNVRVGAVCYDVPLFGSRIMTCEDTRQVRPVQYANWQYYSGGSWSDVVKGTGEPLKIENIA